MRPRKTIWCWAFSSSPLSPYGTNYGRDVLRDVADKSAVTGQGCYVDNDTPRHSRDLSIQIDWISDMTIEACISACASYKYAAVQVY